MIKLNTDQEKAANKIVDFIEGRLKLPFFTLTGAGGTGKTVLLREALLRTNFYMFERSAAAVAHAAKNVICESFEDSIPCYTVAQWLGLKMTYNDAGEIQFKKNSKSVPKLADCKIAILDEASMINDYLYDSIMGIVQENDIKLIVVGDVYQLAPVKQDHDSEFFNKIDFKLSIPMRFTGPIMELSNVYRNAIKEINGGFAGNPFALNEGTARIDSIDEKLNTGYYFKGDIYKLIKQVGDEIKANPDDINFSRMLAYKNDTVRILNEHVRKYIYGDNPRQFELGEILISNGGFTKEQIPILNNGKLLKVEDTMSIEGPYGIPCLSLKFKDFNKHSTVTIPVVEDSKSARNRYDNIKKKLFNYAMSDPKQWYNYYKFIDSFAYFDYAYSVSLYKSQGQSITNVYIMEGEVMNVKPLNLKQKYQALYVAVTRARKNVYIYNKNY